MNKKQELEYKQLLALGVTTSLAYLIIMKKYYGENEEVNNLIENERNDQNELMNAITELNFKPSEEK